MNVQKYLKLEISFLNFKYFRAVKQKKLFIRFLGESMARQSTYSFIWPLVGKKEFIYLPKKFGGGGTIVPFP